MTVFWIGFMSGGFGMIFSQYLFMSESSYFDGLICRKHSFLNLMKAKYYFYLVVSAIVYLLLMLLVWYKGILSYLLVTSVFVYYVGLIYCCYFQCGVYNKTYFDLSDSGFMNWKNSSSSMMVIGFGAMFIPIGLVVIIKSFISEEVACYFMLAVGSLFILGSNYWLKWTYNRMMKRRYIIMDGFRN